MQSKTVLLHCHCGVSDTFSASVVRWPTTARTHARTHAAATGYTILARDTFARIITVSLSFSLSLLLTVLLR